MRARVLAVPGLVAVAVLGLAAQAVRQQLPITNAAWTRPFPPLRIVGNLYYVGTHDLASYLVTTTEGHILINTGVDSSVPMIRSNVEALGFTIADIKVLLATHGHWDHVGGMAEMKRLTGASMVMHEADAPMLEDGGSSDYRFPQGRGRIYDPVKVDRRIRDGDKIRVGGVELTAYHHPGHTKGATSFAFTTQDGGRSYRVLIVNMAGINEGVKLLDSPGYHPGLRADLRETEGTVRRCLGVVARGSVRASREIQARRSLQSEQVCRSGRLHAGSSAARTTVSGSVAARETGEVGI